MYPEVLERDFRGERVIMSKNLKLVVDGESPNDQGFELYDLSKDLGETNNLAADQGLLVVMEAKMMDQAHRPHPNWQPRGRAMRSGQMSVAW